jgi:hypothetical protein
MPRRGWCVLKLGGLLGGDHRATLLPPRDALVQLITVDYESVLKRHLNCREVLLAALRIGRQKLVGGLVEFSDDSEGASLATKWGA